MFQTKLTKFMDQNYDQTTVLCLKEKLTHEKMVDYNDQNLSTLLVLKVKLNKSKVS